MSSLYELTDELMALQNMLEDNITDEALADTLEAVAGEFEIKIESYCKIIRNLEAEAEAHKTEGQRHTEIANRLSNNVKLLKNRMLNSMLATNTTKVKGELFSVTVANNGGVIPIKYDKSNTHITDNLPDELVNYVETPNLDAIRKELEAGKTVDGFSLGERGVSLRIK